MDRQLATEHLAQAETHVTKAINHVVRQRALIADLQAGGYDTALAEKLLDQWEMLLAEHILSRNRVRQELAEANMPAGRAAQPQLSRTTTVSPVFFLGSQRPSNV